MSTNADGSINTQYMSLPNPVPGVTPGTAYASDIYNSLTIIDSHNHTAGSGELVPTAGLNINSDLSLNQNNLTEVNTVRFFVQPTSIPDTSPNTSSLYVALVSGSNELFYNGTTGTPLQITSGGALNVTSSGISNPPASASLIGGALVVKSTSLLAGNIDGGSVLFRNTSPNSTFAVEVSAISGLSSNYSLTLPSVPPSGTQVMTIDVSGNMGSLPYNAAPGTDNIASNIIPAGSIVMYGLSGGAPFGWLTCNGASYPTTTYAALFAVIGYTFGGSGGSFNVPNMQGNFPLGGPIGGAGNTGGSTTQSLSTANVPGHTHNYSGTTTGESTPHTHAFSLPLRDASTTPGPSNEIGNGDSGQVNSYSGTTGNNSNDHTHSYSGTTDNGTGSGSSFSILPPYLVLNFIIKY